MAERNEIVDIMAQLALFADLRRPQLEAASHIFEEEWFTEGQRILRQGFSGSNFYVILDGEAAVRIDGQTRATLGRGEFFGEVSVLLGEPPTADVVALRPLRCVVLGAPEVEAFLIMYPRVMYRMLQAQARRLRNANLWRS
ncbi:MAG: cyclic nucleotide-binding domain-containing protein [Armatimonadetes bacterium]|nr:cyclic nucleotide-binding domain-containing protein [Armatimonadota bacterium]